MKNKQVLIAAPVHPALTDALAAMGYDCIINEQITQSSAAALVADCSGIITSTRLQLDRGLIDAAPGLEWIGRMGSGMEVIDVAYAESKGIRCIGSPEGNCNAVGEHALGMLLALIRRIAVSNTEMKLGVWLRDQNRGIELENKTIGIIGYGHTGAAFAKKLSGFDMKVLAYDKYNPGLIPGSVVNCKTLEPIFEEADIISFHVPHGAGTAHYFNDDFLAAMCKPFIIMNTSRGSVVSLSSLYKGITSKKIIGACLDVFETEPVAKMPAEMAAMMAGLITLPNVITTPHIAGYTFEAVFKMSKILAEKIYMR